MKNKIIIITNKYRKNILVRVKRSQKELNARVAKNAKMQKYRIT